MDTFYNIPIIELPEWAIVINNRYVTYYSYENGRRKSHSIGKLVPGLSDTGKPLFQPNDHFMHRFPSLFNNAHGVVTVESDHYISGIYVVCLKMAATCGLYQAVQRCFGARYGNLIMDYAMMCFVSNDSSADEFDYFIEEHLLFSLSSVKATTLNNMLTRKITDSMIEKFKDSWMQEYIKSNDVPEVWLSIDGSKHVSKLVGSALSAIDNAQSSDDSQSIGLIWAIDTRNGMPVTWSIVDSDVPDCMALDLIVASLNDAKVPVKGVLLDSVFATEQMMLSIAHLGLDSCILLNDSCTGFEQMYEQFANDIRCNVRRLVSNNGIYGCTSKATVFKDDSEPSTVGLFFDHFDAALHSEELNDQVMQIAQEAHEAIQNQQIPQIDPQFSNIILIANDEHGKAEAVEVDFAKLQEQYNSKGFFALATSSELSASEMCTLYAAQKACKHRFTQVKSMLGLDTLRGHTKQRVESHVAVSIIAEALRALFARACSSVSSHTKLMLEKLENVFITYTLGHGFTSVFSGDKSVIELFTELGINNSDLSDLANQITQLHAKVNLCEYRTLRSFKSDGILTESEMHHRRMQGKEIEPPVISRKDFDDIPVKRAPGRPKGSKNKNTLAREAVEGISLPKQHGKRGRPKGSKNKKTLAREAAEALLPPKPPAKIGRPKGSKNKKTLAREAAEALLPPKPPAKIGRPKGSKNKKTLAREAAAAAAVDAT